MGEKMKGGGEKKKQSENGGNICVERRRLRITYLNFPARAGGSAAVSPGQR